MNTASTKAMAAQFQQFVLETHPDPDSFGAMAVYDAWQQIAQLCHAFAQIDNERLDQILLYLELHFKGEGITINQGDIEDALEVIKNIVNNVEQ